MPETVQVRTSWIEYVEFEFNVEFVYGEKLYEAPESIDFEPTKVNVVIVEAKTVLDKVTI